MNLSARVVAIVTWGFSFLLSSCGGDDKTAAKGSVNGNGIDGCVLVTEAEASVIFAQPATRQEFDLPVPSHMIAECEWTWDTSPTPETAANQLIQVYVYDTTEAYSKPADAESYAVGDGGHVRTVAGVDVEWTQKGKTITFSYSSAGANLPPAETKLEAMKTQAQKISQRL